MQNAQMRRLVYPGLAVLLGVTAATQIATRSETLQAVTATAADVPAVPQASKRWVVIFHQPSALPDDADAMVARAGGEVATTLPEIGALVATSSDPGFAARLAREGKVADVAEDIVAPMIPSARQMKLEALDADPVAGPVEPPGDDTQTGPDPFYPLQWDKKRMRASLQGSYPVQPGRRDVVVAVLDTGAQVMTGAAYTPHPDIQPNLDMARSRSFVAVTAGPNGDPNPAAWDDRNGHGSWCLSAVAAPINGIGLVGVAPNVTLVALKVLEDNGSGSFVSVAQALIYSALNKFDVASMSLGTYLPHSDPSTQVLIKLLHRAVNFARSNGVTPIAALGNDSIDISDGRFMGDFILVPGELSGVIGVSATGYFNWKASYSNYGVGKTDVSAPGGDGFVQTTARLAGFGNIPGAWAPESKELPGAVYAFASGTSMAAPNAAGVAALIISQYGDFSDPNARKTHMPPQAVESILQQTANNQPCPEPRAVTYVTAIPLPGIPAGTPVESPNQVCQGDAGYNNFFGKGMVDAFKAVTVK